MLIQIDSTQITLQSMNFDFDAAIVRVQNWINGFIRLVPNIIVASVVIAIFYGLGYLARNIIQRRTTLYYFFKLVFK